MEKELKEIFYWLHRHPELSYVEYETTAKIKEWLTVRGIEILPLDLDTGLVAVIRGNEPGATVAIRCDIDALPIQEETSLTYRSAYDGKMHACGHDFHMTAIMGAAFLLQEERKRLKGTVKVVFQPAEEAPLGAQKIVDTKALEDVEVIFGIHADPGNEVGTLGISEGSVMAAVDRFVIRITGTGCHGGHPDDGVDPVVMAAAMIMSLQTVVSRNISPFAPGVVSVTRIEGGKTWNVIPAETILEGTTRSMHSTERELIRKRIDELVQGTAAAYGGKAETEWTTGPSATINDTAVTAYVRERAVSAGFKVQPAEKSMGGEDFALYLETIKGCFIKVGTGAGYPIHHPLFQIDPAAVMPTASYVANLAANWNRQS